MQLEKYFQEEDDVIRFRSQINEVEGGEKISSYFFRKIRQNREESNVESIKTEEFPNGTMDRVETMNALHKHFKRTFQELNKNCDVDNSWWETLPRIDEELKESLDKPITLNDLTRVLFQEMAPCKAIQEMMASPCIL